MKDEELGGYGIKGLRKNMLTPRPPRARRTFRHYAECRNEGGSPANVLGYVRS